MVKLVRTVVVLVTGAFAVAIGLSLLVYLLFWSLTQDQMSRAGGYSMLMLLFTVPVGGACGGIVSAGWFFEGRS